MHLITVTLSITMTTKQTKTSVVATGQINLCTAAVVNALSPLSVDRQQVKHTLQDVLYPTLHLMVHSPFEAVNHSSKVAMFRQD